jgi:hypothetical protein
MLRWPGTALNLSNVIATQLFGERTLFVWLNRATELMVFAITSKIDGLLSKHNRQIRKKLV